MPDWHQIERALITIAQRWGLPLDQDPSTGDHNALSLNVNLTELAKELAEELAPPRLQRR